VSFSNALGQIASGLLLIGLIVSCFAEPARRPPARFALLLGCWLLACLISTVATSHLDISLHTFIGKTIDYTAVALAAATLVRLRHQVRPFIDALVWTACLVGLDAGWQWFFHHDLLRYRHLISGHLTGPFLSTNNLASYLVMMLPLQLWWLRYRSGKRWKALLAVGVVIELLVLAQTNSRSAWCGLFASLLILAVLVRCPVVVMLGVAFGFGLSIWSKSGSWTNVFSLDPGRVEGWQVAWQMFRDHPVMGIGLGTFMANYLAYVPVLVGDWSRPQYAHNCFLQLLAEGGVVGLAAFTLVVGETIWSAWRATAIAEDSATHLLAVLLASLVACLVNAMFDTGLYSLAIAELFWYLLGLTAGLAWRANPARTASPHAG